MSSSPHLRAGPLRRPPQPEKQFLLVGPIASSECTTSAGSKRCIAMTEKHRIYYTDKLIDELAKGKAMAKILRVE